MKYKAVIFDLDDTLFDRDAAQLRVVELIIIQFPQIFSGHNKKQIVEAFLESDHQVTVDFEAGVPSDGLRQKRSRIFLQLLGIEEEYADTITDMYVKEYPMINIPVPGAVPIVKKVSKRMPVALLSNGLPDVQYKKIQAIGLDNIFSCIVLSEEIGIRKPDLRIFHYTADLLKTKPFECLYIGDSFTNDVVGAKSSGMPVCWFRRESKDEGTTEVKPDFVITNHRELINILGLG